MGLWDSAELIVITRDKFQKEIRETLDEVSNDLNPSESIPVDFNLPGKLDSMLRKRIKFSRYYGHIGDENDYLFYVPLIENINEIIEQDKHAKIKQRKEDQARYNAYGKTDK